MVFLRRIWPLTLVTSSSSGGWRPRATQLQPSELFSPLAQPFLLSPSFNLAASRSTLDGSPGKSRPPMDYYPFQLHPNIQRHVPYGIASPFMSRSTNVHDSPTIAETQRSDSKPTLILFYLTKCFFLVFYLFRALRGELS